MIHRMIKMIPALCCLVLVSCSASRHSFNPDNKYGREALQKDYTVFREVLEENHPSLYWYTSKDSMDHFFNSGYQRISDSMTETQFRTLLSWVVSKISCGHTTVRPSKKYLKYYDTARSRQFPLSLKFWDDSVVVAANLNRRDTILTRGTIVKSLNGKPITFYRDSIFQFLSMDGYGINHKYQSLSNRGNFGGWYRNVFGLQERYRVGYINRLGEEKTVIVPVFDPYRDSAARRMTDPMRRLSRKERRMNQVFNNRNVQVDTAGSTAYLTLNTFTGGNGLHRFFRHTFKNLKKYDIQHLVIDVRSNGGGNVGNSTALTEYLINKRFKLADSLYAINKSSRYRKHIHSYLQNLLFLTFISRKRADGKYHFGYFERHYFKPKKKYHYDGKVYVMIGGNSFSATTLFANCIRQQPNVTIIGEESGGAAYGNTAWLIPDVSLPYTRLRFRLPRFRMVMNKDYPKDGRGVIPDIEVKPSSHAIRHGIDPKVEKVKQLIRASDQKRVSRD